MFSQCLAGTRLPLQPACIQDMVSIRNPNSRLEFQNSGTSPSDAKGRWHGNGAGKIIPFSGSTHSMLVPGCTAALGAALRWCKGCSALPLPALRLCRHWNSQTVSSRVSIATNGEAKIFYPCPLRHRVSSGFICQGGEASEDGVRLLSALPPALNPVFSPQMGPE